ncbi:hypothetical protein [Geminocystis sp. CENA526]
MSITVLILEMTDIIANYDEPWKEAISEYFDYFLEFFFPEV